MLSALIAENSTLTSEKAELRSLLDASNDELGALREEVSTSNATSSAPSRPRIHSRKSSAAGLGFGESYRLPIKDGEAKEEEEIGDRTMDTDELEAPPTSLSEEIVALSPLESKVSTVSIENSSRPKPDLLRESSVSTSSSKRSLSPSRSLKGVSTSESVSSSGTGISLLSPPISSSSLRPKIGRTSSSSASSTSTLGGGIEEVGGRRGSGSNVSTTPTSNLESEQESLNRQQQLQRERDNRTTQLSNLLDFIQRIFSRLSNSDVDSLTRRLQKQHLTGDVGHLARTTVNGIVRDVEGLREHFRKLIEIESRSLGKDDNSIGSSNQNLKDESMVSRKDFYALIKIVREMLVEMAKLRSVVNEIQMNPNQVTRILQEQLGVENGDEKGILPVGGWIARMFTGNQSSNPTSGNGVGNVGNQSQPTTAITSGSAAQSALQGKGLPSSTTESAATGGHARGASRGETNNNSNRIAAPRATAAVVSSDLAVEVKGTHASASTRRLSSSAAGSGGAEEESSSSSSPLSSSPVNSTEGSQLRAGPRPQITRGRSSLTRTQSRNLSGLFVGSVTPSSTSNSSWEAFERASRAPTNGGSGSQRPLSRIVDDDEVSIHQGRRGGGYHREIVEDEEDSFHNVLSKAGRNGHRRNLSDSSIHSTFIEDGNNEGLNTRNGRNSNYLSNRPSPINRIITPSTLSLQVSGNSNRNKPQTSTVNAISSDPSLSSPSLSEDSNSTASGGAPSRMRSLLGGGSFGLPSLRTATSTATLSLSNAGVSQPSNRRTVSSTSQQSESSVAVPISTNKDGSKSAKDPDLSSSLAFGRMGRSNAF